MRRARVAFARRLLRESWRRTLAIVGIGLWPVIGSAELVPCSGNAPLFREALVRIGRSVDPCGESDQLRAVLDKIARCAATTYRVCMDSESTRNVFDRPPASAGPGLPRTITWNPELRDELESACEGDPTQPVLRDPIASLVHELTHAAQDCEGLNPGEHELEAVAIENVYRRAAGLCQRTRYGNDPLPPGMRRSCRPGECTCSTGNDRGIMAAHDAPPAFSTSAADQALAR